MNYNLLTKYSENFDLNDVLKDYPRPQLKRSSYINLNGVWKYDINNDGNIDGKFKKDLWFSGFGFISIKGKCTIKVKVLENTEVYVTNAIIG